jgi:hypothetical protein
MNVPLVLVSVTSQWPPCSRWGNVGVCANVSANVAFNGAHSCHAVGMYYMVLPGTSSTSVSVSDNVADNVADSVVHSCHDVDNQLVWCPVSYAWGTHAKSHLAQCIISGVDAALKTD